MFSSIDNSQALSYLKEATRPQADYSHLSPEDRALRERTDSFEAIMIKTILDTSMKFENALYQKEAGSEIYEHLYKDNLAQNLSGGFGYSELLFNFLKEQNKGKTVE